MDDENYVQDEEEAEEAISLCDFPITNDQTQFDGVSKYQERRSTSEPSDFFEFFNNLTSEMSHAEDIIFCGKLVPFKEQPLSNHTHKTTNARDHKLASFQSRRSESMSELKSSQSNSAKTRVMRASRSMDYQKLHRNLSSNSTASEIHRNSSLKSCGSYDGSGHKVWKPRWYDLMFGLAKFPPEMELKDMKSRQVRRTPTAMFPPLYDGGRFPVNRSTRKGSSWGLLRVLSCKDHASVAVTASFGCMPGT
ncbi:uncharacterized protein LOC127805647 [Diospyros lotus]|uniref:uncharacterized protein LOC127805647 n=1 Tax=Diospyros lotus TaxID=55363 RepID=UPI002251353D|nr:uncharacterized protein LOC127805647 [Diospyros lotus]